MTLGAPRLDETLGFDIDDGTGLRVAHVRFESEAKFLGRCSTGMTESAF